MSLSTYHLGSHSPVFLLPSLSAPSLARAVAVWFAGMHVAPLGGMSCVRPCDTPQCHFALTVFSSLSSLSVPSLSCSSPAPLSYACRAPFAAPSSPTASLQSRQRMQLPREDCPASNCPASNCPASGKWLAVVQACPLISEIRRRKSLR